MPTTRSHHKPHVPPTPAEPTAEPLDYPTDSLGGCSCAPVELHTPQAFQPLPLKSVTSYGSPHTSPSPSLLATLLPGLDLVEFKVRLEAGACQHLRHVRDNPHWLCTTLRNILIRHSNLVVAGKAYSLKAIYDSIPTLKIHDSENNKSTSYTFSLGRLITMTIWVPENNPGGGRVPTLHIRVNPIRLQLWLCGHSEFNLPQGNTLIYVWNGPNRGHWIDQVTLLGALHDYIRSMLLPGFLRAIGVDSRHPRGGQKPCFQLLLRSVEIAADVIPNLEAPETISDCLQVLQRALSASLNLMGQGSRPRIQSYCNGNCMTSLFLHKTNRIKVYMKGAAGITRAENVVKLWRHSLVAVAFAQGDLAPLRALIDERTNTLVDMFREVLSTAYDLPATSMKLLNAVIWSPEEIALLAQGVSVPTSNLHLKRYRDLRDSYLLLRNPGTRSGYRPHVLSCLHFASLRDNALRSRTEAPT